MVQTIKEKRQEVIGTLIEQGLSGRNRGDLEACLNAHLILSELTDQEITYSSLILKENITRLIEAACDLLNEN